jgi:undecaprenyl-diphosphatase
MSISSLWRRHHPEGFVLLAFLAAALGLLAFLTLATIVYEGETFSFDRAVLLAMRSAADPAVPSGPHWLRSAMVDITALGDTSVLTLITIAVTGYLLAAKRAETALLLVFAVAGGSAMSSGIKVLVARARPDVINHLVEVGNASFPSGHAMNSAIAYLTLGALLARTEKSRAIRVYLIGVAVVLTLLIGCSRVYLGVHWPSDVAAGWCLGGAWAILCSLTARWLQRRRMIEPEG